MDKFFKKIGIIYNPQIKESKSSALSIKEKIENGVLFSLDELKLCDLAIVIGGDGSFLKVARHYSTSDTPILGFNVGRLGYLAQAKPENINSVIEKLKTGNFSFEERLMLKSDGYTALNDIVVKGKNCARTATLDLYINDNLLCSYVADGLIISTPTGSTAYSLSAGGPIVAPSLNCFLIIPICPHTLNTRPLVVLSTDKITIKSHEKEKLNVSFDGQVDIELNDSIKIEKNEKSAKLLVFDNETNSQKDKFYDILKEKLHWSIAPNK